MKQSPQCQSCGMPMKNDGQHGTEKDGSRHPIYCTLCYDNGAFRDPEMTVEKMQQIVDEALLEKGSGRIFRWLARTQVPRLKRWR